MASASSPGAVLIEGRNRTWQVSPTNNLVRDFPDDPQQSGLTNQPRGSSWTGVHDEGESESEDEEPPLVAASAAVGGAGASPSLDASATPASAAWERLMASSLPAAAAPAPAWYQPDPRGSMAPDDPPVTPPSQGERPGGLIRPSVTPERRSREDEGETNPGKGMPEGMSP